MQPFFSVGNHELDMKLALFLLRNSTAHERLLFCTLSLSSHYVYGNSKLLMVTWNTFK